MNLPTEYQSFIHLSRYARWRYDEERREKWSETIGRYFDFFKEDLKEKCDYDFSDVERKELEESSNLLFTKIQNTEIKEHIFQAFNLKDAAKAHALIQSRQSTGSIILKP